MFGFFRRLFPPPPPPPPPTMFDSRITDDWKPGDLAQCICGEWPHGDPSVDPKLGEVRRVSQVLISPLIGAPNVYAIGLYFVGYPQNLGWHCMGFRKIGPASREFTTEIRKAAKRGAKQPEKA